MWHTVLGPTVSVCNQPTRSTQSCIPAGSPSRVPASLRCRVAGNSWTRRSVAVADGGQRLRVQVGRANARESQEGTERRSQRSTERSRCAEDLDSATAAHHLSNRSVSWRHFYSVTLVQRVVSPDISHVLYTSTLFKWSTRWRNWKCETWKCGRPIENATQFSIYSQGWNAGHENATQYCRGRRVQD